MSVGECWKAFLDSLLIIFDINTGCIHIVYITLGEMLIISSIISLDRYLIVSSVRMSYFDAKFVHLSFLERRQREFSLIRSNTLPSRGDNNKTTRERRIEVDLLTHATDSRAMDSFFFFVWRCTGYSTDREQIYNGSSYAIEHSNPFIWLLTGRVVLFFSLDLIWADDRFEIARRINRRIVCLLFFCVSLSPLYHLTTAIRC